MGLSDGTIPKNAGWIGADQYERIPNIWSIEEELAFFSSTVGGDAGSAATANDNRFNLKDHHSKILEAAEKLHSDEEKKINYTKAPKTDRPGSPDGSSSSSETVNAEIDDATSSDSSESEADPLSERAQKSDNRTSTSKTRAVKKVLEDDNDDTSSSSSDDGSSDSTSSSSDEESVVAETTDSINRIVEKVEEAKGAVDDQEDDFLVPVSDNGASSAFEEAQHREPTWKGQSGDKSPRLGVAEADE